MGRPTLPSFASLTGCYRRPSTLSSKLARKQKIDELNAAHGLAQFKQLADVPPEEEWLANITNLKTRRAYKEDVREFIRVYRFAGLHEATFRRPVAYYFLAQGHGKTRVWRQPAFGASFRRCPRSSIISANATLSPAIRWTE
jgi:hypothetical protein